MRITLICLTLIAFSAMLFTNCEDGLRCDGDRQCIEDFGPEFLCYQNQCTNKNRLELPQNKDAEPQPEPETKPEPKPEPKPQPEPEPVVKEDPPVERIPDTPAVVQKKLNEPCKDYDHAPLSEQCGPGLRCVRTDGQRSFCFQDCSSNSSVCTVNNDGRTDCKTVAWDRKDTNKRVRVCVTLRKEGESCDPIRAEYCSTTTGKDLICEGGVCKAGKLCKTEGCDCMARPGDPPIACDIENKLVCNFDSGKCIKGLASSEGLPCGNYENNIWLCPSGYHCVCRDGLSCVGGTSRPQVCLKDCNPKNPIASCSHRPGFICKTSTRLNKSYCIQETCTNQNGCAFQSHPHECAGKEGQRACIPLPPPGTLEMGEVADLSKGQRCKHPFIMLGAGGGKGFCSLQCIPRDPQYGDSLCAKYGGTARCTLTISTLKLHFCGWGCSNGNKCPPQLTCNPNGACVP